MLRKTLFIALLGVISMSNVVRASPIENLSAGAEKILVSPQTTKNNSNRWGIELSKQDKYLIAQIVYCEARNQTDAGERAVVEVILNRLYSKFFPNTVEEVLSQENQFETWELHFGVVPTQKEIDNVNAVLNGDSYILPFETCYFSTLPANEDIELVLGGHTFCNQINYQFFNKYKQYKTTKKE